MDTRSTQAFQHRRTLSTYIPMKGLALLRARASLGFLGRPILHRILHKVNPRLTSLGPTHGLEAGLGSRGYPQELGAPDLHRASHKPRAHPRS